MNPPGAPTFLVSGPSVGSSPLLSLFTAPGQCGTGCLSRKDLTAYTGLCQREGRRSLHGSWGSESSIVVEWDFFSFQEEIVFKHSIGFVLGNQGTPDTILGITCHLLSDWKNQSSEDCHRVFLEKDCSGKLYEAMG